jgi:hypothetical protein
VASSPTRLGRENWSWRRLLLISSITPPPNWFLSDRHTVYPGMVNLYLGRSLVSLIAATSILFTLKNRSSSAFLFETEFAFQATMRKLRVIWT